jgi:hypothetical protein
MEHLAQEAKNLEPSRNKQHNGSGRVGPDSRSESVMSDSLFVSLAVSLKAWVPIYVISVTAGPGPVSCNMTVSHRDRHGASGAGPRLGRRLIFVLSESDGRPIIE